MSTKKVDWEERQKIAMEMIQEAVDKNERAPLNDTIPGDYTTMKLLTVAGLILIEVYSLNWRVVQIISSGERTKECPHKNNGPYKVIDKNSMENVEASWEEREQLLRDSIKLELKI